MPERPPPQPESRLSPASPAEANLRLDVFLAGRLGSARSQAQRLVRAGRVLVGGQPALKPSQPIRPGDEVVMAGETPAISREVGPQELHLVYQDRALAVVDKPAGMVVHPGPGHRQGTLTQLVQGWGGEWSRSGGDDRAGIVHRLDRGTSGLLVLARTEAAHRHLARQLRSRSMGREYWALAQGRFREDRGRIEAALGRDPKRPRRMAVSSGGREAATEFFVLERFAEHTALRLRLLSGRTHQIRVHLAYIGRPLAGDGLYGGSGNSNLSRPALHAGMLHFQHPDDSRELTFLSPLPADLEALRLTVGAPPGSQAVSPWDHLPSAVR